MKTQSHLTDVISASVYPTRLLY